MDEERNIQQRTRRCSRGSQSSVSHSNKPDYNPDKYANMSPVCNGATHSPAVENFSVLPSPSQKHQMNIERSSYFGSVAGLPASSKTDNENGLHKRVTNHVADFTNGSLANDARNLNRRGVSVLQDMVSKDLNQSPSACLPNSLKLLNHLDFSKNMDALSSSTNGWSVSSPTGIADEVLLSPDSERSQTTSLSMMSTSVDSNSSVSHGSASLTLLLRQPSEAVLAQQYFPVTFGATVHQPTDSKDPLLHVQPTLTLSKKTSRSSSAGHRRHHRPGSGHSSSSSNSKSSIDRIYLMASDAQGNGLSTVLASTPYQTQLAKLQREQLEIEEERLRHLKIQADVERARSPIANWAFDQEPVLLNGTAEDFSISVGNVTPVCELCRLLIERSTGWNVLCHQCEVSILRFVRRYEIKSPQFHYEARKHNERLKGAETRPKNTRYKPNP